MTSYGVMTAVCNQSGTQGLRVKVDKEQQFKPVSKHAVDVHVWAAI